ncbi:MAG: pyridoxamine 5'-phosphate oxidase family protein [Candidatus Hermodarchaeota archaeon]
MENKTDHTMNKHQKEKIWKLLKSITYCSLSTCFNGVPHTTVVQPAITPDWKFIILAKNTRTKVRNLKHNNRVWLTFDATSMFKIPRVVYVKGEAKLDSLNQRSFEEFVSYHGWITKKIIRRLASGKLEQSTRIIVIPEKFITVGLFAHPEETVSFIF